MKIVRSNPVFPIPWPIYSKINCFISAFLQRSKQTVIECVSRNAEILLSNLKENLASSKIIKIIQVSIRFILHYLRLKSDFKAVKYLNRKLTLKIYIFV